MKMFIRLKNHKPELITNNEITTTTLTLNNIIPKKLEIISHQIHINNGCTFTRI